MRKLTPKQQRIAIIQEFLLSNDWQAIQPPNSSRTYYHKTISGRKMRFNFQDNALRYEVWNEGLKEWIRLQSGFYANWEITTSNTLVCTKLN
jgi:hypothetical protein